MAREGRAARTGLLLLLMTSFVSAFVPPQVPRRGPSYPSGRGGAVWALGKGENKGETTKAKSSGGLFSKKTTNEKFTTTKKVVKSKSAREAKGVPARDAKNVAKHGAAESKRYGKQTLQRDNWDVIEKQRIPLSSILIGGGAVTAVGSYFFSRYWAKRSDKLITDFVDDMMVAGMDKKELYRVVVDYKNKLGPFATPRMLNEYLKAVFRAPDLTSQFVEVLDTVVNKLLKVKDDELVEMIAGISNDMAKSEEFVGMSILLFVFDRILPANVADSRLDPLRRALDKALPGDVDDNMFELAKDAYSLEVETLFSRGESPLLAPEGYDVLGLKQEDADAIFKRVKASYEGPSPTEGGADGPENLSQSLIVKRKEPLHDMLFGTSEEIAEKFISGYKEEKEKKKQDKLRGRPPTIDETVKRISAMVLTKEGEELITSLQKFQCLKCRRVTTLMPNQTEDDTFHMDYKCPQCGAGRDMIVRKN